MPLPIILNLPASAGLTIVSPLGLQFFLIDLQSFRTLGMVYALLPRFGWVLLWVYASRGRQFLMVPRSDPDAGSLMKPMAGRNLQWDMWERRLTCGWVTGYTRL